MVLIPGYPSRGRTYVFGASDLLSLRPQLKPLFMSGYPSEIVSSQGEVEEGLPFIQTPFSAEESAAKVREAPGRG